MAWGRSQTPTPPRSTFSQLVPLIVIGIVLAVVAFVGYQVYVEAARVKAGVSSRLGKKNVVFTKDGVRVGVKHVENEEYVDRTQSYLVKAWNLAGGDERKRQAQSKNK